MAANCIVKFVVFIRERQLRGLHLCIMQSNSKEDVWRNVFFGLEVWLYHRGPQSYAYVAKRCNSAWN